MAPHTTQNLPLHLRKRAMLLLQHSLKDVVSLKGAGDFLTTFFTAHEREILLRRLAVLILLEDGQSYGQIQHLLGLSRSTISKISHILKGDGYGKGLKKIIYSTDQPKKRPRKRLLRPYKGAKSII